MVELLPDDPVSPLGRLLAFGDADPVDVSQHVDVVVGRHPLENPRRGQRAFGVHVAPPEDGLGPPGVRRPAMLPDHRPQLRVDAALDAIGRRGKRPFRAESRIEVGEERPRVHEPDEAPPGLPQPVVGEDPPAVHDRPLLQEVVPELAPLHQPLDLEPGLEERLDGEEVSGQGVELDAGLQLRTRRCVALDLAEGVEGASLHARGGPRLASGLLEAASPVRHDDLGRGDLAYQRLPRPRVLASGHVPAHYVLVRAGDQDDEVPGEVYPVDVDDAVDLSVCLGHGLDCPEPLGLPPEGLFLTGHVDLPALGEEPHEEGRELLCRGVDAMRARRPADLTPPPLRPGARLAVSLHAVSARRTSFRLHLHPLDSGNFFPNLGGGERVFLEKPDTRFVQAEKLGCSNFSPKKKDATCGDAQNRTHFLSYKPH